jgi:curved DNA-binding protein
MAIEYKDYYKSLGVPRTASADEIRKAFRALARKYHPDVAKDKATAESRFKEINEAYEVLGDPEKRKKYDELGADWKQGAQFRPPPGWGNAGWNVRSKQPGSEGYDFHFGGTGFSDFFEQVFGSAARGGRGFGDARGFEEEAFSQRGGDVESDILVSLHEVMKGSVRPITLQRRVNCHQCYGTGEVNGMRCSVCGGEGQVIKTENYKVKIPAGVREGQRLRLPGHGEPGQGRAGSGDLYLRVRLEKHPDFRVEDSDLYAEVEIAPWEAVLGATVEVPSLEDPLSIRVPAGAQSGQKLRVRGKGIPQSGGRGDLFVILRVQVPERISDRERQLWQQLASESSFQPRSV